MKGAKGHHHGHHHKHMASGGASREHEIVSGNPDVLKEAEGKEDYAKGDERKHGGRAKHHRRAAGGKVLGRMTGGGVKARMDRPARARGGGVGSDRSPFTSAHRTAKADAEPKSQEGGASD